MNKNVPKQIILNRYQISLTRVFHRTPKEREVRGGRNAGRKIVVVQGRFNPCYKFLRPTGYWTTCSYVCPFSINGFYVSKGCKQWINSAVNNRAFKISIVHSRELFRYDLRIWWYKEDDKVAREQLIELQQAVEKFIRCDEDSIPHPGLCWLVRLDHTHYLTENDVIYVFSSKRLAEVFIEKRNVQDTVPERLTWGELVDRFSMSASDAVVDYQSQAFIGIPLMKSI